MRNWNKRGEGFWMSIIGMIVKPIIFALILLLIIFLIWKYVDIPGVIDNFLLE